MDHLSNGRAVLGVRLGRGAQDFTAFVEEFGYKLITERVDEVLTVITGLWSRKAFVHHGKYCTVDNVTFLPKPVQESRLPIWIGGESLGALKRVSRYDGWVIAGRHPVANAEGLSLKQVSSAMERIKQYRYRDESFDVVSSMDLLEEEEVLKTAIEEADSARVIWLIEGIYGLRCTLKASIEQREERFSTNPVGMSAILSRCSLRRQNGYRFQESPI